MERVNKEAVAPEGDERPPLKDRGKDNVKESRRRSINSSPLEKAGMW